jgi:N-(2-amino-2-carboxyethyl)-L-glutamate synthase
VGSVIHDGLATLSQSSKIFVSIRGLAACPIQLKLEGLNIAGSIKIKTALQIIGDLEERGLPADAHLIESSSGNLGVAVALVCAGRGYRFTCVTDPNSSDHAVRKMRALGTEVIQISEHDATGNYLATRISLIERMCERDPRLIWLNQYANDSNPRAHYLMTGPEILSSFPRVDYLFIGAGTTGTLSGCGRYFRDFSPTTKIVGVDSVGSITFGSVAGRRFVPGLGTSCRPEIADPNVIDDLVMVHELDAVRICRELAGCGLPVGGSTGSVVHAVRGYSDRFCAESTVVAISPDLGDKYLDTVYDDQWVDRHFAEAADRTAPAARRNPDGGITDMDVVLAR